MITLNQLFLSSCGKRDNMICLIKILLLFFLINIKKHFIKRIRQFPLPVVNTLVYPEAPHIKQHRYIIFLLITDCALDIILFTSYNFDSIGGLAVNDSGIHSTG